MNNNDQKRFEAFTKDLTELSKKYGIILEAIGGVSRTDLKDPALKGLTYTDDLSSGDLEPRFNEEASGAQ